MLKKPKPPMTDYQQYKKDVMGRLMSLNAEETGHIKNLYGKPELVTISKIMGDDVTKALADGISSIVGNTKPKQKPTAKKRGLGTR